MILCNPLSKNPVWIQYWDKFVFTSCFSAKLRLLHQGGNLQWACTYHTKYEAWLCYYIDSISLNSQAGQWNVGTHCYGQLDKKGNFMSFQPVRSCLSVYRHNITPHFNNLCLSQMSLPTFKLPFYKSMCQFYVMWYSTCIWNNKIYCNIVNCFCRT